MRGMKLKGEDRVVGGCAVAHEEIVVIATRAGLRQAHLGRRVPGAGPRRVGPEGGQDRQGARGAVVRRARDRGGRVRHPTARCGPVGVGRARAARDGGGSKVAGVDGELLRVVAVSAPPPSERRRSEAEAMRSCARARGPWSPSSTPSGAIRRPGGRASRAGARGPWVAPSAHGAGFSTVFQSRVVRYVRNSCATCTRSSCVLGCRSS